MHPSRDVHGAHAKYLLAWHAGPSFPLACQRLLPRVLTPTDHTSNPFLTAKIHAYAILILQNFPGGYAPGTPQKYCLKASAALSDKVGARSGAMV